MDDFQSQCLSEIEHRKAAAEDQINLLEYLRVVYRYRRMVISVCAAGMVLTAIVILRSPRVYSATTKITPPMNVMQDSGLAGSLGAGGILRRALETTNISSLYVAILKSRAVTDAIIDKFDLMGVYGPKKLRSEVRQTLEENTAIVVSGEGIVNVTVKDRDPNRAASLANAYVEELDRQNKRLSTAQVTSKKLFLENRLKEVEGRLSKIDNILSREAKIQEMFFELFSREYELAKIEEVKSMPTIQVLDRAIVPETPQSRGGLKKTLLAGVASFMLGVFAAFAHDFAGSCRRGALRDEVSLEPEPQDVGDTVLAELENKRRIVATHRRKRSQESQSHASKAQPM